MVTENDLSWLGVYSAMRYWRKSLRLIHSQAAGDLRAYTLCGSASCWPAIMLLARDRDLLVGVCCVPHLQGAVRRAPRPGTMVMLMARDTRMRTGDACCVSAVGYSLRVSRQERTVLRQSPWCHKLPSLQCWMCLALSVLVVAAQPTVLDVLGVPVPYVFLCCSKLLREWPMSYYQSHLFLSHAVVTRCYYL